MQDQTTQTGSALVTQEIVTAKFKHQLTALKYNEALQYLTDLEVSKDNLGTAQEAIKRARGILKQFDIIKTNGKAPALAECRMWDSSFKSISEPFSNLIEEKSRKIQEVATKIAEENRKAELEKQRVANIKTAIDAFILEQTQAIVAATKTEAIVAIEKLLGSHKANESRYQEFLPELVSKVDSLSPIIKKQKGIIKDLEKAEKEQAKAKASGDDAAYLAMEEKKELLQYDLDETKNNLQETAINSAINSSSPVIAEEVLPVVNTRRKQWKYEVVDEKKAFAAGMLITEINTEKAKTQLAALKETLAKDQEEVTVGGIRYFLDKQY